MFHSVACRMMFTLGANTTVVPPLADDGVADASWRQKNQLRKLFWLIYSNDKEISLRTGQPPSINDDDCDLELPRGYLGLKYVHDRPESEPLLLDDTAVPLLPGDVRLDMIKSRTYTLLYSARSLRKSDAELISDIRQLDDELEAWRLSVPPGFRPILSLREKPTPPDLSEPRMMESVMIHVEYHHLVATIHEATSRCRSWSAEQSDEADGLDSSLALAVEASRSTLFYMHAIVHNLMGEAFWCVNCSTTIGPSACYRDHVADLAGWLSSTPSRPPGPSSATLSTARSARTSSLIWTFWARRRA